MQWLELSRLVQEVPGSSPVQGPIVGIFSCCFIFFLSFSLRVFNYGMSMYLVLVHFPFQYFFVYFLNSFRHLLISPFPFRQLFILVVFWFFFHQSIIIQPFIDCSITLRPTYYFAIFVFSFLIRRAYILQAFVQYAKRCWE